MKRIGIAMTALLLTFLLTACGGRESSRITDASYSGQSSEPEATSSSTEDPDAGMEDAMERYCALYHAEDVFRDVLVPQKALLIGEEQIVELTWFSGYAQTRVIERSSLVRVENSRLDTWDIVNLYDKTNQCITIMLEPGRSEEIVALLE